MATFRAHHPQGEDDEDSHLASRNESGRILRDNVYGNQEDDAQRRDFTINALYYDPASEHILDYAHGVHDIRNRLVRLIGDPEQRYLEDPVRMLRAVRFAAKLGFGIDPKTRAPIRDLADLLENVPAARLFEEMLKLLLSGHSAACLAKLRKEGLHHGLLPLLDVIVEQPLGERFLHLALDQTDTRIRAGKSVSPAFLFAALLWHEVLAAWKTNESRDMRSIPALYLAMDQVLDAQTDKLSIPRRLTTTMKEIWSLQPRLEQRSGKRALVLLTHPRFRAGYDFMLLRAESGEVTMELANWWTRFQDAEMEERNAMLIPDAAPKKRPRRRRKSKAEGMAEPARTQDEAGN